MGDLTKPSTLFAATFALVACAPALAFAGGSAHRSTINEFIALAFVFGMLALIQTIVIVIACRLLERIWSLEIPRSGHWLLRLWGIASMSVLTVIAAVFTLDEFLFRTGLSDVTMSVFIFATPLVILTAYLANVARR